MLLILVLLGHRTACCLLPDYKVENTAVIADPI